MIQIWIAYKNVSFRTKGYNSMAMWVLKGNLLTSPYDEDKCKCSTWKCNLLMYNDDWNTDRRRWLKRSLLIRGDHILKNARREKRIYFFFFGKSIILAITKIETKKIGCILIKFVQNGFYTRDRLFLLELSLCLDFLTRILNTCISTYIVGSAGPFLNELVRDRCLVQEAPFIEKRLTW